VPRAAKSLVTLHPPLQVMQPMSARVLPKPDALPGGVQYSVKLDGIRAVCFTGPGHDVTLQSRRGTVLNQRFPQLIAPLAELPVGLCPGGGDGYQRD
jgi:ATP-dependent DNA ligase